MRTILTWVTLGWLLGGCGGGDTPPASTSTPAPPNLDAACSKLIQYCRTGYVWSSYVTDEQACRSAFQCIYGLYTGDCRQTLGQGIDCLAALTDASGCSACQTFVSQLQPTCPDPQSCVG